MKKGIEKLLKDLPFQHISFNFLTYGKRATLYNTIELLLDCDLIKKHQFGQSSSHFEKSFQFKQHDHLILENGEVIEFCDPRIQNIRKTIEEIYNVDINDHKLYFYGKKKS